MKLNKYRLKKISKQFFILITFLSTSVLNKKLLRSEENINWQILKKEEFSNILNWEKFNDNYYPENYQIKKKEIKDENFIKYISDSKNNFFTEIDPHLPTNIFLKQGSYSSSIQWKSTFDPGLSGGIGQQNNSFIINYGINDNFLIKGYFSEADDLLYNKIKNRNHKTPYRWQSFAISLKNKLFKWDKTNISLVSTLEYWKLSSGSRESISIYNNKNILGKEKYQNLIGSFSLPISYQLTKDLSFYLVPGITFSPDKLGKDVKSQNSYGNNLYIGTGLLYEITNKSLIYSSLTYPLGPGDNYFNSNLQYEKTPIYTLGFNYQASPRVEVETKITNSYGSTPSTSLFTIPSGNQLLYYGGLRINHSEEDIDLKEFSRKEERLRFGGLSVNNAYLPRFEEKNITLELDNSGTFFTSYSYSISNILQMQLVNIGRYKGVENNSSKYTNIRNTYLSDGNSNYRIGGKINILSPLKGDSLWLSSKISVGRNDTNNQGYIFSELINTINISEDFSLSLNPKAVFSGVGNSTGLGIGANYYLNKKVQLIPELNVNFTNTSNNNYTFSVRYLITKDKAIDSYISNAAGFQDVGQIIKANDIKYGFKFNIFY